MSRSTYYRISKAKESEEIECEKAVINCFEKHNGNYGRIRIKKELARKGLNVSENKVSRILHEHGLVAKSGRTGRRKVSKPTEEQYIEENLIKNKFEISIPNYLWCSDITELKCKGSNVYVCGIIDVATRRLVGWSIKGHQRQDIVQEAFHMAVGRNPERPANAVYHSDRGCQYTAKKTKEIVEKYGFRKSMSRPGTPNDNQPIESFWHTLECEMPDIRHLTFEGMPKALDWLIVVRSSRARHAFSKTVFFNYLFGFLGCILTASVTVIDRIRRAFRISAYCHMKSFLNYILTLMTFD